MLGVPWWDALFLLFLWFLVVIIVTDAVKKELRARKQAREYEAMMATSDFPRPTVDDQLES
jgi:hypothetical protein